MNVTAVLPLARASAQTPRVGTRVPVPTAIYCWKIVSHAGVSKEFVAPATEPYAYAIIFQRISKGEDMPVKPILNISEKGTENIL